MSTDKPKQRAAEIVSGYLWSDPVAESVRDEIALALSEAVAEERERCAKIVWDCVPDDGLCDYIAAKIREKGGENNG